ncbi:hypothetical protein FEM48_Zijuj09G0140800 [Ziziphus jujuba var. spinosa]|uniref:Tubulin alpha-6 chain n=1 Tax=Ziziphus jujuba var. spinosa TaxID=714518 RepID=A0A978UTE6_ZIZJJ|nr:hypothetical protein FEM48_Zijuj09G0140800 [Ziziphus jujuba var. spinosa]
MASVQMLRYTQSPIPVSQTKPTCFYSESCPKKRILRLPSSNASRYCTTKRFRVCCAAQGPGKESNGEEPPESLFMKELRKRGMTPTSLLEDTNRTDYGPNDETSKQERAFSQKNAVSTEEVERSLLNQKERSMMLNSEGLEGLIPRAKLLLTIGGTFFLGFWPLILITVAFFSALYLYFGSSFIHDASKTPISPPQYIDPYALLEEERISQIAPRVN